MADYVDDKQRNRPPLELELGWQCERFQCLPEAGGLLNQPLLLIRSIVACLNVYEAYSLQNRIESRVDFAKQYPDYARLILDIEELRDG